MPNFKNNIELNKNMLLNARLQPASTAPASPLSGQFWSDTTVPAVVKPMFYNGTSWIDLTNVDNYVNGATWGNTTGILTLTRTGGLGALTVNLDGRYLTQNDPITLSGEVTSTSSSTAPVTTLHPTAITNKAATTNAASGLPTGVTDFLVAQDGALRKYSSSALVSYVGSVVGSSGVVTGFTRTLTGTTDPVITHTITTGAGSFNTTFQVEGTVGEVEVSGTVATGVIKVGLPDNLNLAGNLTLGGNLTVNGTVTTVNTETINLSDNIITLNSNYVGSTPTENAGIEINRGTLFKPSVVWNEATDRWTFSNDGTVFNNLALPSEYNFYVHPTQTAITSDNSGLTFIQDIAVNTSGHVTSVGTATIPTGAVSVVGVVALATVPEATTGTSTTVAVTPAGLSAAITANNTSTGYKTTITASGTVTHNLNSMDVTVELVDLATGETIYADVARPTVNTVTVTFGLGAPANTRVLIRKI